MNSFKCIKHKNVKILYIGVRCNVIRSNGIRSKGVRSNVLNVTQQDILLFKKSEMNDQNQLPLEIYQDQWIHLNALNTKMSSYYKLE